MTLKLYKKKRSFKSTPEPKPKKLVSSKNLPIFCVQKHDATRLHYDFRIECKGVMLSWAIPKGPSLDPSHKRLAVHVEDHPIEYSEFEGIIPEGNYGAGTVMVWDEGTYSVNNMESKKDIEKTVSRGLENGHIEIDLHGHKLNGRFILQRLNKDDDKNWLFIKKKDDYADVKQDVTDQDRSVKTDRTLNEIAGNNVNLPKKKAFKEIKAPKRKMPEFIKPMLASLVKESFDNDEWLFEIKWDGYRALARIEKKVALISRSNKSFNGPFSPIIDALSKIKTSALLDGEIVVLDKEGKSNFQLMQNYQRTGQGDLFYYVFDILFLDGKDLRDLPLIDRKKLLKDFLESFSLKVVRYSDHVMAKGNAFFREAEKKKLEGIMAKKMDSRYVSRRSREWLKIKTHMRQEAVIGGFTAPQGSRKYFGALLLGVYDKKKNLIYIGHVGTGFDTKLLKDIYDKISPLIQDKCSFKNPPKTNKNITWLKPQLVCEISFSEWTTDKIMRQPVFMGLRIDKKANSVIKEETLSVEPRDESKQKKTSKKTMASKEKVKLVNLDKIFWPKLKLTKGDLIEYYQEIADYILPYLKNRPVMLKRFPDGVKGEAFIQKDTKSLNLPSWVQTIDIVHNNKVITYFLIQNKETLQYVVNLGTVEIHAFLSQINKPEYPVYFVIDLDPEDIEFAKVIETAQTIHEFLEDLKIPHVCKTSGKRGLHICIPMGQKYTFDKALEFGQIIIQYVHSQIPEITSLVRQPSKRQKKVYLDILQNHYKQTVVAPYSVRGTEDATISAPLKWNELKKGLDPSDFNMTNMLKRVNKWGDIFAPALGQGFDILATLKEFQQKLESIK